MQKRLIVHLIVWILMVGCVAYETEQMPKPIQQPVVVQSNQSLPNKRINEEVPVPPPPQPFELSGNWFLLFADEFDAPELDAGKWVTCYWWDAGGCTIGTNHELQWYQPDDVLMDNGLLRLRAQERPFTTTNNITYNYTSGMITTGRQTNDKSVPARFAFQYGYAEIRARVPQGKGLWPAFWLLPVDHNSKPEIDVMEILGDATQTVHMNFHFLDVDNNKDKVGQDWVGPDFADGWHTFGVDWQPDEIIWYVDGVERWRYEDTRYIPAEPMYLLLNLAVGGDWPGPPDNNTAFPSHYEIDYVRVWRKAGPVYFNLLADSFVDSEAPNENFGELFYLSSDGSPEKITFFTFDATFLAETTIGEATLRIHTLVDDHAGSSHVHEVYLVDNSIWDETDITYENRPEINVTKLGELSTATIDSTYDISLDVTPLQGKMGGLVTLAIVSEGDDGLHLVSRENVTNTPQLFVIPLDFHFYLPFFKLGSS
jgi:beta-glucanase (GH16 family)